MVFAVFVLVFGIVLGVIGFTWGDGLTQWLTEQLSSGLSGRNSVVVRPGKNGAALLMRRMIGWAWASVIGFTTNWRTVGNVGVGVDVVVGVVVVGVVVG